MEDLTILKNELIKKILNSSNIGFLKAINQLFSSFESKNEEITYSDTQKGMLILGEEDIEYGRTISDEELRKIDEEWMNANQNRLSKPSSLYHSKKQNTKVAEGYSNNEKLVLPSQILEILEISSQQIEKGESYTEQEIENYFEEWLKD